MTERVDIGNATLYHGDCLEVLGSIEAEAVISDPPYGINYVHSGGCVGLGLSGGGFDPARHGAKTKPIAGDSASFNPSPLLRFDQVLLFGANHFAQRLPAGGSWLAWDKSVGTGPADSFVDAEFIWTNRTGIKRNVYRHLWKGLLADKGGEDFAGRNPNAWKRHHPSMKPVALMSWCLSLLEFPATVLDPFMGSGSTGVACMRAGVRFIGVELDREYFDIACERIERAQRQADLFTEVA
jgi:site-specific DNA-methyltransferase (adenine-specific)